MTAATIRLGDWFDVARWPIAFALPADAADLRVADPATYVVGRSIYLSGELAPGWTLRLGRFDVALESARVAILVRSEVPEPDAPYLRVERATVSVVARALVPGGDDALRIVLSASGVDVGPAGLSATLAMTWTIPGGDPAQAPVHVAMWPGGPVIGLASIQGSIARGRLSGLGGAALVSLRPLWPATSVVRAAWSATIEGDQLSALTLDVSDPRGVTLALPGLGELRLRALDGTGRYAPGSLGLTCTASGELVGPGVHFTAAHCVLDMRADATRIEVGVGRVALTHLPAPLAQLALDDGLLVVTCTAAAIGAVDLTGSCTWDRARRCCTLPAGHAEPAPDAVVTVTVQWTPDGATRFAVALAVTLDAAFAAIDADWRPRDVVATAQLAGTLGAAGAPLAIEQGAAAIQCKAPRALTRRRGFGLVVDPPDATITAAATFAAGRFTLAGLATAGRRAPLRFALPGLGDAALTGATVDVDPTAWSVSGSGAFTPASPLAAIAGTGAWACELSAGGDRAGGDATVTQLTGVLRGALALRLPTPFGVGDRPLNAFVLRTIALGLSRDAAGNNLLALSGGATVLDGVTTASLLDAFRPGPLRPIVEPMLDALLGASLTAELTVRGTELSLAITATAAPSAAPFNLLSALAALVVPGRPLAPPTVEIDGELRAVPDLFTIRTREVVLRYTSATGAADAAFTLELGVLGLTFTITASIGIVDGHPQLGFLLGDTQHGGEPILVVVPSLAPGSATAAIDHVARSLQVSRATLEPIAQAFDGLFASGKPTLVLELSDVGIACKPDDHGGVVPEITGTVQVLAMPGFLDALSPSGFFVTLSSDLQGISIATSPATRGPLIDLPLGRDRSVSLFLDQISFTYRWADNIIRFGGGARVHAQPASLLTAEVNGTGVKVSSPITARFEAGVTVTPPPIPVPEWNFDFAVPGRPSDATDQLGAQIFLGDDGTSQLARAWIRHSSFSPSGWLLSPALISDGGLVIGGPSPRRRVRDLITYRTAQAWLDALVDGAAPDRFRAHLAVQGLTLLAVQPAVALILNPLVVMPLIPALPPYWIGPLPTGPLGDVFFDEISASINLPGVLQLGIKLQRPLPELSLEALLSLAAVISSGFQIDLPADSPLHRIYRGMARVRVELPFTGRPAEAREVEVDLARMLDGLGDLVAAIRRVATTTADLVAALPDLVAALRTDPSHAVRMIPREARVFTASFTVAGVGLSGTASLVLVTPDECLEELVLFHESRRPARLGPRARTEPVRRPVVLRDYVAPGPVVAHRAVRRATDDATAIASTPGAHARATRAKAAMQLALAICATAWSDAAARRQLVVPWGGPGSDAALEALLAKLRPAAARDGDRVETARDTIRNAVYRWAVDRKPVGHPIVDVHARFEDAAYAVRYDLAARARIATRRLVARGFEPPRGPAGPVLVPEPGSPFDLVVEPPGEPPSVLVAGVAAGSLWSVRRDGDRYLACVIGTARRGSYGAAVVARARKHVGGADAGGAHGVLAPDDVRAGEVAAVLRRWTRERHRLVDATDRAAAQLSPARRAQLERRWEEGPALYQQSMFFRDEYRITERDDLGDVVGRRGGVYFADLLHHMAGAEHRYVTPSGPVFMAGFATALWGQRVQLAGLVAPAPDGPAFLLLGRGAFSASAGDVGLTIEGDLVLATGTAWPIEAGDDVAAGALTFRGSMLLRVGGIDLHLDGTGTVTTSDRNTWFDMAGVIELAVHVPIAMYWINGAWIGFRAVVSGRFDGGATHTRTGGLRAHAGVAAACRLEQYVPDRNGGWTWVTATDGAGHAVSLDLRGEVTLSPDDGLVAKVHFPVPGILAVAAQLAASLDPAHATYDHGALALRVALD